MGGHSAKTMGLTNLRFKFNVTRMDPEAQQSERCRGNRQVQNFIVSETGVSAVSTKSRNQTKDSDFSEG